MPDLDPPVVYFPDQGDFHAWLEEHHESSDEQWVGFYKKATGKPSITWEESVDEALCFGWIDGLRKSIDGERYKIRFTPRRPGSHWSAKNLARIQELLAEGLVRPAGREIYEGRNQGREKGASYEQTGSVELTPAYRDQLASNPAALAYFEKAAPSYRKQVSWWVISAKKEETRQRRLSTLIESCAAGEVIPPLRWSKKK